MALNSTRPGRGTSLILYLGAVVMPRCSSSARSLPARTGASARRTPPHPHPGTSSLPQCHLGEGTLCWPRLLHPGPSATAAPQQVSPEPLGPRGPLALSQKAPLVMHLEVRRAVPPEVVTHVMVPADQWADSRCSWVRYGECEPSIIQKEMSMRQ
jgi:hypothetical protein